MEFMNYTWSLPKKAKKKQQQRLSEQDLFFITYDEPDPERSWQDIKSHYQHAQRVDKVKGFDKAHKTCASLSHKERFVSIDGDNTLYYDLFSDELIPHDLMETDYVLSWSSRNSINGLCYGNGGIKCWPTHIVHQMRCHEESEDEKSAVDFCFQLKYYQMPSTLSLSVINQTPYQAFRSGFREGVKFGLIMGEKIKARSIPVLARTLQKSLAKNNKERLHIWGSVGQDVKYGAWAIYGARLGLYCLYIEDLDLTLIRDYDWFNRYWSEKIVPNFSISHGQEPHINSFWDNSKLQNESCRVMLELNDRLGTNFCELAPEQSLFFKNNYRNPVRQGLML